MKSGVSHTLLTSDVVGLQMVPTPRGRSCAGHVDSVDVADIADAGSAVDGKSEVSLPQILVLMLLLLMVMPFDVPPAAADAGY